MTEPARKARTVRSVIPGVLHWSVEDDRIAFRSEAYAVTRAGRSVLIDPLPLTPGALGVLGTVRAICLTGSCHQRSSWRLRRRLAVPVLAPHGALGLEEEPDGWYRKEDRLPGGLVAVHAPGPAAVHYAFHLRRGRGVLFCADVLLHDRDRLRFIEASYQDEPARTRLTARRFLRLPFDALCPAHGAPVAAGARAAVREALADDARRRR